VLKEIPDRFRVLRHKNTAAYFLIAVFAVLYFVCLNDEPDVDPDACSYILLAKALVSGNGFTDIFFTPNTPHTRVPFVFPVMLAPLVYLFGYDFVILKILMILLGLLSLWAVYSFFEETQDAAPLLITALTGISPLIISYSHFILTEIPYLLFSFMALFFIHRYRNDESCFSRHGVMAALFLILACFTRSIGIGLFAAAMAFLLFDAGGGSLRIRKMLFLGLPLSFGVALWGLRSRALSGPKLAGYMDQLFTDPYRVKVGGLTAYDLVERLAHNAYGMVFYAIPENLMGFHFTERSLLTFLLTAIVGAGFLCSWTRKRTVADWYVTCFIGILLVWPWTRNVGTRFMIPVAPLLFYYFLVAVRCLGERCGSVKVGKTLSCVGVMLLCASNLVASGSLVSTEFRKDWSNAPAGYFVDMATWVRENNPADVPLMTTNSAALYIWSDRRSVYLPMVVEDEEIRDIVMAKGVRHIDAWSQVDQWVKRDTDSFTLVFKNEGHRIYRFHGDRPGG
jgi:hypothetical protein